MTRSIPLFFDFMIRPPSTSPLFPYTTLFRSILIDRDARSDRRYGRGLGGHLVEQDRAEEHTPELQSPDQLVCRRLLEQKNWWSPTNIGNSSAILNPTKRKPTARSKIIERPNS